MQGQMGCSLDLFGTFLLVGRKTRKESMSQCDTGNDREEDNVIDFFASLSLDGSAVFKIDL